MQMQFLLVQPSGRSLTWLARFAGDSGIDGFRLHHAENLSQGIAYLVEHGADLVLFDRSTEADSGNALLRLQCIHPGTTVLPFRADPSAADGRALDLDPDLLRRAIRRIWVARKQQRRMIHRATHDRLTGLANRWLLEERVEDAVKRAERNRVPGALLFIDLDAFKTINDRYGHDAGDLVLQTVAERLRCTLRATDTVARYGGDEFVALLEMVGSERAAAKVVAKIRQRITEPLMLPQGSLCVQASVGVAMFPDQGTNLHDLIRRADRLMYRSKFGGGAEKARLRA